MGTGCFQRLTFSSLQKKDLEHCSKSFLICHQLAFSARPLELLAAQLTASRVDVGPVF